MPRGNVVNPPCAPCQARSSSVINECVSIGIEGSSFRKSGCRE